MRSWVARRWSLVAGLVLLFLLLVAAGMAAQTGHTAASKPAHKTAAAEPAEAEAPDDRAEIDALKSDLLRMQSLVTQMQSNLGYVSTTMQPLRHQFELEIEMWQIEMGQTQRRLQRLEANSKH